MYRGKLTVIRKDGTVVTYSHVIKFTVKSSMIECTTWKEGEARSKRFGVIGWKEYEFE